MGRSSTTFTKGHRFSGEIEERRIAAIKVFTQDPGYRAKQSAAMMGNKNALGYKHSPAAKAALRVASMGNQRALGYKHTDESKAIVSAKLRGNQNALGSKHSPESRAARSAAQKGKKHSKETKAKMSIAAKRRARSPKGRAQMAKLIADREAFYQTPEGKIQNAQRAIAIAKSSTGKKCPEATKEKIRIAAKQRMMTPEGKATMAAMNAARYTMRPTKFEGALYGMLDIFSWEYKTQVSFPPFFVDAYIPGLHLALEADGPFHFEGNPFSGTTAEQEAQLTRDRDAHLLDHFDLEVWHFNKEDLGL